MPSLKKRLVRAGRSSVRSLSDPLGPLAPSLPSVNRTVHRYQKEPSLRTGAAAALAVSSYAGTGGGVGKASKLSRGLGFTRSASDLPLINAGAVTRARSSLSSMKRAASSAGSSAASRISSAGSSLPGTVARSRLGRGLALGVVVSQVATRVAPKRPSPGSSSISSAQGLQAVAAVHTLRGDPGISALKEGLKATRARLVGTGSTPRTEGRGRIRSIGNPAPDRSAILREEVKKAFASKSGLRSTRTLRGGLT
jgi:hypothetical protein